MKHDLEFDEDDFIETEAGSLVEMVCRDSDGSLTEVWLSPEEARTLARDLIALAEEVEEC